MQKIVLILLIAFISGCNSSEKKELILFNEVKFKLKDEEKTKPINIDKKNIFDSYHRNTSIQFPLFRCIESKNYIIFIAFPLNTSLKETLNLVDSDSLKELFSEEVSGSYSIKQLQSSNEFLTIYSRTFNGNLVYVFAISESKEVYDEMLNPEAISDRFKTE